MPRVHKLATWIGLAVAVLLGAEVGLRIAAYATHRERALEFDRDVGWRQRPNLVKVGRFWSTREPARLNSRGWRDGEHAFDKPANVRRVVALGDSFTFGAMVEVGERYTERLAAANGAVEVINLGTSAYGTDQELRLLEIEGLRYAPDVVIAQVFLGNDLDDIRYERHFAWPKPHYELETRGLRFVAAQPSWDVWFRESSYLGELAFDAIDGTWIERNRCAPALASADTVPLLCALVTAMDACARQARSHLLAVLVYPCERMREPPLPREARVRAALDLAGLALLDTQTEFAARTQAGAQLYSQPDGHWNAAGHALAAELIQRDLARRRWLE